MITSTRNQFSYLIVTLAYWVFMLSDGALRMLVLLHFHLNGFSPLQLASLFLFYELAGIATNVSAGWLAAKYGLKFTLYSGLSIQIIALYLLSQLDENFSTSFSIFYVLIVQGLSGVAKDLTKMSSKSAVKLLTPDNDITLFRWVAILTGSKNTIKGFGFFVGCILLSTIGFYESLIIMALIVSLVLVLCLILLKNSFLSLKQKVGVSEVFSRSKNINFLSAARVFLFSARDVWFVVALPIFFYGIFSDGSVDGNKKAFFIIGIFMASWVILYGLIQANSPKLFFKNSEGSSNLIKELKKWGFYLFLNLLVLTILLIIFEKIIVFNITLFIGLLIFCGIFAINSSLHSYLILNFSKKKTVTLDVGYYYMANAAGRLIGTFLSGISYQLGGLTLSLTTACLLVVVCLFFTHHLSDMKY